MNRKVLAFFAVFGAAACGGGSNGPTGGNGIASVRMIATAISLFPLQTEQLSATALDASGGTVANAPAATWQSANNAIATVTSGGLVTGVANGQTDITASIGGKAGSTRVTVGAAPLSAVVDMPGNSFTPFTTTIRVAGTVSFRFPATAHNVIFKPRAGTPADILPESNVTITRTFNALGTFAYDCTLHSGMSGEVVVVN
ncbi:MAG: Ig-like domain-containing protein [Cytophagaceae bacterium]|nr:Ig-like domain-containing protein [Gemmatimonadaceae bacterium]